MDELTLNWIIFRMGNGLAAIQWPHQHEHKLSTYCRNKRGKIGNRWYQEVPRAQLCFRPWGEDKGLSDVFSSMKSWRNGPHSPSTWRCAGEEEGYNSTFLMTQSHNNLTLTFGLVGKPMSQTACVRDPVPDSSFRLTQTPACNSGGSVTVFLPSTWEAQLEWPAPCFHLTRYHHFCF